MNPQYVRGRTRDDSERTRSGDAGRRAWLKSWWSDGGKDLVLGVSGIVACIGCLVLGYFTWQAGEQRAHDQQIVRVIAQEQLKITRARADQQRATAATAKLSCERSRTLGPLLASYYALDPKFPRAVLAEYRRTIPKTCPK